MDAKHVVVAGAGGNIGSHLVRSLARMPQVRSVTLIDRDTYEPRNVVNQDISWRDVGKSKAVVQARRLAEIRPALKVAAFHAPLESLPLSVWRADLILACLDSRAARQVVNERAWRMGSTWIDSGVLGQDCLARVNVYTPSAETPCLECAFSEEDYRSLEQQYPCGGTAGAPAPNGASSELGALAASLLAIECRKMLSGETDRAAIGRQVTIDARWHRLAVTSFRRNSRCRFDHASWPLEPRPCSTRKTRLGDLLELADRIRVPGQRFVRRLFCPACREEKRLFHLEGSLSVAQRQCRRCRQPMTAAGFDIVETVDRDLPPAVRNQTLHHAGLRHGDVFEAGDRYFVIAADSGIETKK